MVNPFHSLRQAAREAFARAPSQHDERFDIPNAQIGSVLRIRLPEDWLTSAGWDGQTSTTDARGARNDPAEGLFVRWTEHYNPIEDCSRVRMSVSTRELPMPHAAMPVDEARRQFFLQHYRGQYEEMCRRAREAPRETFHCEVIITARELALDMLYTPTPLTRQLDAGREARDSQERARAMVSERERCEKRSMELLWDWLSPEQRKELALEHYFTITGEHSGKRYQIHRVYSFGLKELDEAGNVIASYCVVPEGTKALGDTMLAQKVWMETDERATLERANKMPALASNVMLGHAAGQMLAQPNPYQNAVAAIDNPQRYQAMQAQQAQQNTTLARQLYGMPPDA